MLITVSDFAELFGRPAAGFITGVGAVQSFKEFGDMVGPLLIDALTHFFGVGVGFISCGALALFFLLLSVRSPAFNAHRLASKSE